MLTKTFDITGDFHANHTAEFWLTERGFSVGRMQGPDQRGILFGDYDISKWRNMRAAEVRALHGVLRGDMRNGPVTVELFDSAPEAAKSAFVHEREVVRAA